MLLREYIRVRLQENKLATVILPAGSKLFHGTGETFSGELRGSGYDKLIWFTDSPAIAQLYIPQSGGEMYLSVERLIKPSQDPDTQLLQRSIGIDYHDVEWKNWQVRSYANPRGWEALPTKEYAKEQLAKLGYEEQPNGIYRILVNNGKIMRGDEKLQGKLYIATVMRPLKLWRKSVGEGDLMDVQYHDLKGFDAAKAMGYDGVLIDDFAQSKEWGNIGHLSVGLFGTNELRIKSIPAQYHEWDRNNATPEYPQGNELYLHTL